jgi:hypothetical protein
VESILGSGTLFARKVCPNTLRAFRIDPEAIVEFQLMYCLWVGIVELGQIR